MSDEWVPLVLAKELLEVIKKHITLFVLYARESIVGVFSLEVDDELSVLMVVA